MERIGDAGWFMTNEEHDKFLKALAILESFGQDAIELPEENKALPYDRVDLPYDQGPVKINEACPNCPWAGKDIKPWLNPADWTWRPWQAPWYGIPSEPVPTDYKVGDGEWWKHQPYCTSTTEGNPNVVKDTKTDELVDRLKDM